MRYGIIVIVLLTLFATPALAASLYDDVPREHWSYLALDYLEKNQFLVGYPDGFFKTERTLTRYEFAQAIARTLNSMAGETDQSEIALILTEALRDKFSDHLSEIYGLLYTGVISSENWQYEHFSFLVEKGFLPACFETQFNGSQDFNSSQLKEYAEIVKYIFDLEKPDSVSIEDWITSLSYADQLLVRHDLSLEDNSYAFVLPDHWSYTALDFLRRNVAEGLKGYPEGFFKAEKILTKYEFAQAADRLLDSMGAGAEDQIVNVLAEALREEYSDHLAEIGRIMIEQRSLQIQSNPSD